MDASCLHNMMQTLVGCKHSWDANTRGMQTLVGCKHSWDANTRRSGQLET